MDLERDCRTIRSAGEGPPIAPRAARAAAAIPVSRLLSPSSPPHAADAPFEGCRRAIPQVRRTQTLVMRCARRPPSLTTPRRSIVRVVAFASPCRKFSALALALDYDTHISVCLHLLTISCDRFRVIAPTTFLSARASPTLKKIVGVDPLTSPRATVSMRP